MEGTANKGVLTGLGEEVKAAPQVSRWCDDHPETPTRHRGTRYSPVKEGLARVSHLQTPREVTPDVGRDTREVELGVLVLGRGGEDGRRSRTQEGEGGGQKGHHCGAMCLFVSMLR